MQHNSLEDILNAIQQTGTQNAIPLGAVGDFASPFDEQAKRANQLSQLTSMLNSGNQTPQVDPTTQRLMEFNSKLNTIKQQRDLIAQNHQLYTQLFPSQPSGRGVKSRPFVDRTRKISDFPQILANVIGPKVREFSRTIPGLNQITLGQDIIQDFPNAVEALARFLQQNIAKPISSVISGKPSNVENDPIQRLLAYARKNTAPGTSPYKTTVGLVYKDPVSGKSIYYDENGQIRERV